MLTSKIYVALFILATCGGIYFYYTDTQNRLQLAAEEVALHKVVADSQTAAIRTLTKTAEKQQKIVLDLSNSLEEANIDINELRKKLNNHDLTKLATAKPGLIETRINNATQNLFNDLESITSTRVQHNTTDDSKD